MEFHFGELFPRVGFIVTHLTLPSRAVVRFYNKRGTAEVAAATIKEGKQAVSKTRPGGKMTRLSCNRFRSNEVRLWLSVLPTLSGRLVLPKRIGHWSLTSFAQRLVKTGGRLIKLARYYWLLLAESVAAATRGASLGPCCAGSRDYHPQRGRRAADRSRFRRRGRLGEGKVSEESVGKAAFRALGFSGDVKLTPSVVRGSTQH